MGMMIAGAYCLLEGADQITAQVGISLSPFVVDMAKAGAGACIAIDLILAYAIFHQKLTINNVACCGVEACSGSTRTISDPTYTQTCTAWICYLYRLFMEALAWIMLVLSIAILCVLSFAAAICYSLVGLCYFSTDALDIVLNATQTQGVAVLNSAAVNAVVSVQDWIVIDPGVNSTILCTDSAQSTLIRGSSLMVAGGPITFLAQLTLVISISIVTEMATRHLKDSSRMEKAAIMGPSHTPSNMAFTPSTKKSGKFNSEASGGYLESI